MEPYVAHNSEELSKLATTWIATDINEVLKRQDRFTIALSGGTTPKKIYELLASAEFNNQIDW